jgi:hypothetical protein
MVISLASRGYDHSCFHDAFMEVSMGKGIQFFGCEYPIGVTRHISGDKSSENCWHLLVQPREVNERKRCIGFALERAVTEREKGGGDFLKRDLGHNKNPVAGNNPHSISASAWQT